MAKSAKWNQKISSASEHSPLYYHRRQILSSVKLDRQCAQASASHFAVVWPYWKNCQSVKQIEITKRMPIEPSYHHGTKAPLTETKLLAFDSIRWDTSGTMWDASEPQHEKLDDGRLNPEAKSQTGRDRPFVSATHISSLDKTPSSSSFNPIVQSYSSISFHNEGRCDSCIFVPRSSECFSLDPGSGHKYCVNKTTNVQACIMGTPITQANCASSYGSDWVAECEHYTGGCPPGMTEHHPYADDEVVETANTDVSSGTVSSFLNVVFISKAPHLSVYFAELSFQSDIASVFLDLQACFISKLLHSTLCFDPGGPESNNYQYPINYSSSPTHPARIRHSPVSHVQENIPSLGNPGSRVHTHRDRILLHDGRPQIMQHERPHSSRTTLPPNPKAKTTTLPETAKGNEAPTRTWRMNHLIVSHGMGREVENLKMMIVNGSSDMTENNNVDCVHVPNAHCMNRYLLCHERADASINLKTRFLNFCPFQTQPLPNLLDRPVNTTQRTGVVEQVRDPVHTLDIIRLRRTETISCHLVSSQSNKASIRWPPLLKVKSEVPIRKGDSNPRRCVELIKNGQRMKDQESKAVLFVFPMAPECPSYAREVAKSNGGPWIVNDSLNASPRYHGRPWPFGVECH
ncbi:uncharacterized protein CLUP02_04471 [Colletotrichum lupini]|uniref:Uncharacterized protein n=1 Tax=Colletotrichum lupini TaxID=145971 RepID=A0A9Q8SM60_9PEZI|nr:uncharacterized protein CLUP02_04471 [Colletotrichum lupini]UQC78992.1 hypothetical protein CLUP02_04471 [Colletotrichum lupini]